MKGPEYVANVVDKYRRALDAAHELKPYPLDARDEEELRYSFSRSFSHGFLGGSDHQQLVHGLYPGHRGVLVGRVEEVHARAGHVLVRPDAPAHPHAKGDLGEDLCKYLRAKVSTAPHGSSVSTGKTMRTATRDALDRGANTRAG